jgi:glycerol-3-phosphate acyltransferase PlsY
MKTLFILIGGYLLGSIPFSYLVTRIQTGKDIRQLGSKNVGATNVLRTTGKIPGIIALILDVLKGSAAVWITRDFFQMTPGIAAAAGFTTVVGHSYPIFLSFKGGKSVATGAGAFCVLSPFGMLSSIGLFVMMLFGFRIVSLASMIASASFPLFAWVFGAGTQVVVFGAFSALWIVLRHRQNLIRLFQGTERKMGISRK